MVFKIFYNANFIGEYQGEVFYNTNEVIGQGSVITISADKYSVRNLLVRKNGEVVLEVGK